MERIWDYMNSGFLCGIFGKPLHQKSHLLIERIWDFWYNGFPNKKKERIWCDMENVKLTKLERLELKERNIRQRIRVLQGNLRVVCKQKQEVKNLEINRMIKSLRVPREELYDFLKSGANPSKSGDYKESEVIDDEL